MLFSLKKENLPNIDLIVAKRLVNILKNQKVDYDFRIDYNKLKSNSTDESLFGGLNDPRLYIITNGEKLFVDLDYFQMSFDTFTETAETKKVKVISDLINGELIKLKFKENTEIVPVKLIKESFLFVFLNEEGIDLTNFTDLRSFNTLVNYYKTGIWNFDTEYLTINIKHLMVK